MARSDIVGGEVSRKAQRESVDRRDVGTDDLRILRTIAEALNGATNVEQALEVTLDQVARLLGLETGWIWLVDPISGRYYSAAAQHLPPFLREPIRMTGQTCWCLKAFAAGELTAGNIDVMECSRLRAAVGASERAGTSGLRCHASIPLYFGGRGLGIMNVAGPAWRTLSQRELDLLTTIASQVGVAIERARLANQSIDAARVEERARLARQLHDTLAQRLTAIGLHVEAAMDVSADAATRVPLQRALDLARAGLDEARGAMRELRTPAGGPLTSTLEAMAHAYAADTGIRVHVTSPSPLALAIEDEVEIGHMVGEALTNVRKHASATEVTVAVTSTRRGLRVEIADNGRGFNTRRRAGGFGILGLRERAALLRGHLKVISRPGHGTRVVLTIPQRDRP
jgi:two-component system NarL family sensor kinase